VSGFDFTGLQVIMDATEEGLPGVHDGMAQGQVTAIGGVPRGTAAGLASVALVVTLDDGTTVFGETTLALLNGAVRALTARYPDPRP
jgi:hypothetical protein